MTRPKILRTATFFISFVVFLSVPFLNADIRQPQVCVLLGYPGSGKGTFAQSLDPNKYQQLSFGDILRNELRNGSPLALAYKDEIEMNKLDKIKFLPEEIVRNLLDTHLTRIMENCERIILDGYPKTIDQAIYLDNYFQAKKIQAIFVYVNTNKSLLVQRILGRLTCTNCAHVFNLIARPPLQSGICDLCQSPLFVRGSDTEENEARRIQFFEETSLPLVEFYKRKGILHEVDNNNSLSEGCAQFHEVLLNEGFIYEFE